MVRLAKTVREQGYKVALSGEGADEALAGYIWFRLGLPWYSNSIRGLLLSLIGGGRSHTPPFPGMRGVLTVQQWVYDIFAQSRELLYGDALWSRLDGHSAYDDLDLTQDRMARWHPRNQSIYAAYKIMLPGHLLSAKGDRAAMSSSVETRYPFLDESVIEFCAGIDPDYKLRGRQNKWLLRKVACRSLPPRIARRPKTMFRATWSATFLGPERPPWVDQLLSHESLIATGLFDPRSVDRARRLLTRWPRVSLRLLALDVGLTMVVSTQLWHQTFCGGGLADLPTWSAGPVEGVRAPARECPGGGSRLSRDEL